MRKLLIALALFCAPSMLAQTRYVDAVSGSDTWDGTAKTHTSGTVGPWKSSPGMQGNATCSDNAGAHFGYSHTSGEQKIFKGGVTWPAACFGMNVTAGGSSSFVVDYYGVDLTWFTGGSFTRPVFDLQNTAPITAGGAGGRNVIWVNGGFITFDNIEIKRQFIVGGHSGPNIGFDCAIYFNATSGNIVKNGFFHDWISDTTNINAGWSNCAGGIGQNGGGYDAIGTTISGANSTDSTRAVQVDFGGCFANPGNVSNSHCTHTGQGVNGFVSVHDSEFDHISANGTKYAGPYTVDIHTNTIQQTFPNANYGAVYNNYIHENTPGQHVAICPGGSVYNNVMWGNSSGSGPIQVDSGINACLNGNQTSSIYNNTVADCQNFGQCLRIMRTGASIGTVNVRNNLYVTTLTSGQIINQDTGMTVTVNNSNFYIMGASEATTFGFTSANKYKPTSSDSNTVSQGMNLTSLCGGLTGLCNDTQGASWFGGSYAPRPSSLAWDIGAYQLIATSPAPAVSLSRTSIAFGNQNVSTSSANVNTVVTNTGTANLTVSSVAVTGTDLTQYSINTNTCTVTILPAGTCSFNTVFSPTSTGLKSAFSTVTSNAATSPDKVTLSGTGTNPIATTITVTPSPVAFGNQVIGIASSPVTVTITSTGTGNEVLGTPYANIIAGGSNPIPGDFGLSSIGGSPCSNGLSLGPGVSCTFAVTMIPTQSVLETATLNVNGTVNGTVQVSGTGIPAGTNPAPAQQIFANYPFPKTMDLTITNCNSPCKVRVTCTSGCSNNVGLSATVN